MSLPFWTPLNYLPIGIVRTAVKDCQRNFTKRHSKNQQMRTLNPNAASANYCTRRETAFKPKSCAWVSKALKPKNFIAARIVGIWIWRGFFLGKKFIAARIVGIWIWRGFRGRPAQAPGDLRDYIWPLHQLLPLFAFNGPVFQTMQNGNFLGNVPKNLSGERPFLYRNWASLEQNHFLHNICITFA